MKKICLAILAVALLAGCMSPQYRQQQSQQERQVINRYPDIEIMTNDGKFVLTDLATSYERRYIGWDPFYELCLSATLKNNTNTKWNYVSVGLKIKDITGQENTTSIYFSGDILPNTTTNLQKDVSCPFGEKKYGYEGQLPQSISATFENGTYPIKYTFLMSKPVESKELLYEDKDLKALFMPSTEGINFVLQNKTDNPLKIDWNQVSYIDPLGISHKAIHSGIRYIEKDSPRSPMVVPPTAKVSDIIVPTSNIYYDGGKYGTGWKINPLFPETGPKAEGFKDASFGIFMPVEINSKIKNYTFTFQIVSVEKK